MLHRLPLPTPFPVGPVNVYLAEGDPLTLIDTGPKVEATLAALELGLGAVGHRLEAIRRVIITHHHVDHTGLAAEVVARSGAEVWAHPLTTPWLVDYAAERERHRPFYEHIWQSGGVPEEVVAAMDASGAGVARWQDPVTPARELNEGDVVILAGASWTVYHTPGHAGGLICLWQPDSRVLLANDHLIRDVSSNPIIEPPPLTNGPRPKRLVEYLHHLQRLAALEPVIAWPGHGEPVDDVAGLVRQRLAFHARRKERLLRSLAGKPQTLWELTQATFGDRLKRGMDWFLGCSEILGHLDLLEADGTAHPISEGVVVKWTKV